MAQRLTEQEITALADAFSDEASARRLLDEIAVVRYRQPVWSGSSLAFWGEISHRLGSGMVIDGRRLLFVAAARWFPDNAVFAGSASPEVHTCRIRAIG